MAIWLGIANYVLIKNGFAMIVWEDSQLFCIVIVHDAIPLIYGLLSFARPDAFPDDTIDLRPFLRYEELRIVIALWHAVDLLKLLFDCLQFFYGQAMQKGAIKSPQLALEASFDHIVGVGAWHLMFTPLLRSIALKLSVLIC